MISAIIVTHNREAFLGEAIDSVLAQTYFQQHALDWELLVIDDGSSDGTRHLVTSYLERCPNLRYAYQEQGGVSRARNLGLKLARGEYLAFLDSDDLWIKEKIQVQMSYLKAFPEARFCLTEEIWIRKGRRVNPGAKHRKYSGWVLEKVLPLCLLSLSSAMFRRQLFEEIGGFDEEFPVCEDYDLGIRIALRYPYYLISTPLIIKRGGHPDQLSQKYWGMDRWRIKALEKALILAVQPEQKEIIKKEIQRKCQVLVEGFLKRGNLEEARSYQQLIDKYSKPAS